MQKVFLHVDLDAFFASVEQLDHPEWKGKPVIVGGKPGDSRSVVSTASYEARKYGVHSAMPTATAYKLCPNGIYVRGNMHRYHEKSEEVMDIFKKYSPDVQQMSIDEAFIDITGTEKLFGPPVEVASRLKMEVKEKTGLTVSVGIASTKYLAKIASGLQKPDGLYVVESGKEELFMLNLPLNKVWGIGAKTLERLNSLQIRTTRDVHSRSLSLLQNIIGKATGTFLYNAVRGLEDESFNTKAKSHSISSENTYETDLVFEDVIETALLELCQTVLFRMLKEKICSKTVYLKIRYEDFTTTSAQETFSNYVSNVDDFYEKIKILFKKKYEPQRGIRLLGVGLQNTEPADSPRQVELFDFGENKKQKVEDAILKAAQKNPALKITKARLLKTLTPLLLGTYLFFPQKASAQTAVTETHRTADGAGTIVFDEKKLPPYFDKHSSSLFNYEMDDQNVELLINGFWKASFNHSSTISTGFGTTTAFSSSAPVFMQDVDLSIWLLINRHIYFETAFADQFEKNTIAAGYSGDGFLREARIANRGIVFPTTYSIDQVQKGIGGGTNTAPGLYLKFQGDSFVSDTVLRYDMLTPQEKSWYGKNSVTTDFLELENWLSGFEFTLPSGALRFIENVYVESKNGDINIDGKKFNRLDSNQYRYSVTENTLYISQDAKASRRNSKLPQVIIQTSSVVDCGNWNDSSSFLGQIQSLFDGYDLEKYSYDFKTTVNGLPAIIIQNSEGFSPFAYCNRYDIGLASTSDAQIASRSSESVNSSFIATIDEELISFVSEDFINTKHVYATVFSESSTEKNKSAPINRYPLVLEAPEIYLGLKQKNDDALRIRTFNKVSRYDIGTKAVPGTVRVYKNGILETGATYDEESGNINLTTAVNDSDHIFATWYEESGNAENGSLAFASGIAFDVTKNIQADFAVSTRWSYNPNKHYSSQDYNSPGYAAASSKLNYTDGKLTISNIISTSLETADTTGTYRILSMDESDEETFYMTKNAASDLPHNMIPKINLTSQIISDIQLVEENNGSIKASKGKTSSQISGYAIPVEWNFTHESTEEKPNWAAVNLALPGTKSSLKNAQNFTIALKPVKKIEDNCSVFIQLGVNASEDGDSENNRIPTFLISKESPVLVKSYPDFESSNPNRKNTSFFDLAEENVWQTITISLDELAISQISNDTDVRIIVVSKSKNQGAILAGPYRVEGMNFKVTSSNSFSVYSSSQDDASLNDKKIKKLNSSENKVQTVTWKKHTTPILEEDKKILLSKFFEEINIKQYKELNLWIRKDSSIEELNIALSRPVNGIDKKAVFISITNEELQELLPDVYYRLTVNLDSKNAFLNGKKLENCTVDTNVLPVKFEVELKTSQDGSFSFDELILTEAKTDFSVIDKATVQYKTKNAVFDDFFAKAQTTFDTTKKIESTGELSFDTSRLHGDFSIVSTNQDKIIPNASHMFRTNRSLLNIFSAIENYSYDDANSTIKKHNQFEIALQKFNIPLSLKTYASATKDPWTNNQTANSQLNYTGNIIKTTTFFSAIQQYNHSSAFDAPTQNNYLLAWKDITKFSYSTGESYANRRNVNFQQTFVFDLPILKLKPQLEYSTKEEYKNTLDKTQSNTTQLSFTVPFSIQKNSFQLSWTKKLSLQENHSESTNYLQDTQEMFSSQEKWFFATLPVYDLAAKSFDSKLHEQSLYSSSYSLLWKRQFSANRYDFFIPQNFGFTLSRDITKESTTTDIYQIRAYLTNSAMNLFGKTGIIPLFTFYNQDEFISSIQVDIKNLEPKFSGYFQANFYMQDNDILKSAVEAMFQNNQEWDFKSTITYSRKTEKSPLMSLALLFYKELNISNVKITRKDSFNLHLSSDDENKKQNLGYIHGVDLELTKYISLNNDISFSYDCTWGKIIYMGAGISMGATIKF